MADRRTEQEQLREREMDRFTELRERERHEWREREVKDLDVEAKHGPRPLEGLSSAPGTLWPEEQNDAAAAEEHGDDERDSIEASRRQVPKPH